MAYYVFVFKGYIPMKLICVCVCVCVCSEALFFFNTGSILAVNILKMPSCNCSSNAEYLMF